MKNIIKIKFISLFYFLLSIDLSAENIVEVWDREKVQYGRNEIGILFRDHDIFLSFRYLKSDSVFGSEISLIDNRSATQVVVKEWGYDDVVDINDEYCNKLNNTLKDLGLDLNFTKKLLNQSKVIVKNIILSSFLRFADADLVSVTSDNNTLTKMYYFKGESENGVELKSKINDLKEKYSKK